MKSRILILFAGAILLWILLITRAAFLQILPNQKLSQLKQKQFQTVINLQSRRGVILDRNGRELALSSAVSSLYADPKLIVNKKQIAKKLALVLGISYESVYTKIRDGKKRFIWIQRQLAPHKVAEIKSWNIRGLSFIEEFKRVYPNESLLASTIGIIGSEGQGLEGIELQYDQMLRGNPKKMTVRRDARGRALIVDGLMFADNPDGAEITLTIDSDLQFMLENELHHTIAEFAAEQAFGVILDAQTSEILAIASPSINSNITSNDGLTKNEVRRNKVIADSFEPGSTMKTFVIAAALKNKLLAPNTRFNTENGKFKVGDKIIREADVHHKWSSLTASEILAYSSNIGTTKIAFSLGADKFRQSLEEFGFGAKLGVDLPGEAKGQLLPLPWRPHLLSNISFGHGVSSTPLQLANAYAVIANGGKLNKPKIVKSVKNIDTNETLEFKPEKLRDVISAEEASQLRLMLAGVTSPGATGSNARVDGFVVAGKTGTAQKVNPNGKGYMDKAYISSFAGFIPAVEPRFVIYIAIDHPQKNAYYGSQVAAPVFSRVASYAARKAGLAPVILTQKNIAPIKSYEITKNKISLMNSKEIFSLPEIQKVSEIPELKNLTLREVYNKVRGQDLQIRVVGSGVVQEVSPPSGGPIPEDKKITIILK